MYPSAQLVRVRAEAHLVLVVKVVSLTAAVLGVKVFVDGVQRILLFTAMFPGSQDVPYTLVQEGILALQHTHDIFLHQITVRRFTLIVCLALVLVQSCNIH